MKTLFFKDIPQAFIDAESEAEFRPQNIRSGFFDFKNYYEQLTDINGPKCFISGRKGTGKSAYIYKIKEKESGFIMNLDRLPYKELKKTYDQTYQSHLRYSSIWKLIIITNLIDNIKAEDITGDFWGMSLNSLKKTLKDIGFGNDTNTNIKVASKRTYSFQILKQSAEISSDFVNSIISINDFIDKLYDSLFDLKFKKSFYLLIDGVDDILSQVPDKSKMSDILSSLITVIYDMNLKSKRNESNFKVIMAIRSDIWGSINGPDMNKRAQTNRLTLEWISHNEQEELEKLLEQRLLVSKNIKDFVSNKSEDYQLWNNFFPIEMGVGHSKRTKSWTNFLEHSLYRPRDVIQFMEMARVEYPEHSSLSQSEVKHLISRFSKEYFFDEMRNSLEGFVDQKILFNLPEALHIIGRGSFKLHEFLNAYKKINPNFSDQDIKDILTTLFDNGYIGQRNSEKDSYSFKHKTPYQTLNYANSLVIHRGLYAAIAINN
ncbi:P-loop ATPase, Sll1717 family [Fructobacillus fructosus]|uniref:P-loop ATPase, Sll1717 family n=1 Tax=Fructobacillus fructosus TaxID=1631 RepID=UPI00200B429E|nr:hypothetical protein [Fructobacillus fructosus]MCK8639106.1 hypothetical protein [Fructobacillus fructosus]